MFAMTESTSNRFQRGRLASLLVGASLLFAACGGAAEATDEPTVAALPETEETADAAADTEADGSGSEESDAETSELSAEEAQLAFSQCLEDQGIADPFGGGNDGESVAESGGGDGEGITAALSFESEEEFEAFEAAQEECSELLGDAFGEFDATPEQEAQMADAELKFNQCMSDKGIEMGDDGSVEIAEGDFEKFEEAADECQSAFDDLNDSLSGESQDN